MLKRLFFKLLPVQVALVAMGSVNSIVDGIIAARFIDATSIGVVGLYYTVVNILEAIGGLLLGGTAVMCGRYLGGGQVKETRGVCSLSLSVSLIAGALLTAVSLMIPGTVSALLGASEALKDSLE